MLKSFSKTLLENSGGAENSAEISGTNGINFFCYMYESSLRHTVWVPEINVTACNSEGWPDMADGHVLSRAPKWVQSQLH